MSGFGQVMPSYLLHSLLHLFLNIGQFMRKRRLFERRQGICPGWATFLPRLSDLPDVLPGGIGRVAWLHRLPKATHKIQGPFLQHGLNGILRTSTLQFNEAQSDSGDRNSTMGFQDKLDPWWPVLIDSDQLGLAKPLVEMISNASTCRGGVCMSAMVPICNFCSSFMKREMVSFSCPWRGQQKIINHQMRRWEHATEMRHLQRHKHTRRWNELFHHLTSEDAENVITIDDGIRALYYIIVIHLYDRSCMMVWISTFSFSNSSLSTSKSFSISWNKSARLAAMCPNHNAISVYLVNMCVYILLTTTVHNDVMMENDENDHQNVRLGIMTLCNSIYLLYFRLFHYISVVTIAHPTGAASSGTLRDSCPFVRRSARPRNSPTSLSESLGEKVFAVHILSWCFHVFPYLYIKGLWWLPKQSWKVGRAVSISGHPKGIPFTVLVLTNSLLYWYCFVQVLVIAFHFLCHTHYPGAAPATKATNTTFVTARYAAMACSAPVSQPLACSTMALTRPSGVI